jgi:hypothetical protein
LSGRQARTAVALTAAILMAALDLQMRVRPDAEVELHLGMDKLV